MYKRQLLYFDEKHYNQNKEILSKPDELITVSNPNEKQMKPIKKDLDKDINTTSYDYFVQGTSKSNIAVSYTHLYGDRVVCWQRWAL